jgi:small GTP-binding protein
MYYQYENIQKLIIAISEGKEESALNEFNNASSFIKEQELKRIDIAKLSNVWQSKIIEGLHNVSLRELHLRNCTLLTSEQLKQLLNSMTDLLLLNLQGCTQIGITHLSDWFFRDIFNYILQSCQILQKIDLSNTGITEILIKENHKLQQLYVNNCQALTKIEWLIASYLQNLSANHCNLLEKIDIKAQNLLKLSAKECINLNLLNTNSHKNAKLYLEGCKKLEKEADKITELSKIVMTKNEEYINNKSYKIYLVGETGGGRYVLIQRLITKSHAHQHATIGANFYKWDVTINYTNYKFDIWESSGQERYIPLVPLYMRGSELYMVCFNLTSRSSFERVETWNDEAAKSSNDSTLKLLVGMKCDLKRQREIRFQEAVDMQNKIHAEKYFETSSQTGEGVEELFQCAAKLLVNKKNNNNVALESIRFFKPAPLTNSISDLNQNDDKKEFNSTFDNLHH